MLWCFCQSQEGFKPLKPHCIFMGASPRTHIHTYTPTHRHTHTGVLPLFKYLNSSYRVGNQTEDWRTSGINK